MGIGSLVLRAGVVIAVGTVMTGCVIEEASYREHRRPVVVERPYAPPPPTYVPAPQPVYVEPAPPAAEPVVIQAPPPEQVVVVHRAPPPPRHEFRPRSPGRDFVWIDGYWAVQDNRWVWVAGRWDRPPHPGAHWQPRHWENHGGEFRLSVGGWH